MSPNKARKLETALLVVGVAALGYNLRGAITSLPPIFPELTRSLRLSAAEVSVLASVPVLCFGVVSGFAAWFARRLGEELVLGIAAITLTAGLLLRAAVPGVLLFPGTVLAAGSIAVMNVLLSSLIKRRWPDRAGMLVGVYITFLSLGAIVGSIGAVPVWDASGGSVPLALGWLAAPAALALVLWIPQCFPRGAFRRPFRTPDGGTPVPPSPPRGPRRGPMRPAAVSAAGPPRGARGAAQAPRSGDPKGAKPPYRYALAWQVMAFMGIQSLLYYGVLSYLPTILRDRGASPAAAGNLAALMGAGNLAVSLIVPVVAQRMRSQRALVVPTVLALAVGLAGAVYAPLGSAPLWVLILGAGQNAALSLAIFFTMARAPHPAAAASLSGLAQSGGYLLAAAGPLELGLLHSATRSWNPPLIVLFALSAVLMAAGLLAARDRVLPDVGRDDG